MNAYCRRQIAKCGVGENQCGFSLIEVVITLSVIALAVAGVLTVLSLGIGYSSNPLVLGQAMQLAQGETDQVLGEKAANGFSSIAVGNPLPCKSTMLAGFNCNRNIYYVNAGALNTQVGGPTNYMHVTVAITHTTVGNVNIDTIISNY